GGQLEALRLAYQDAGFSPATLGYVEAHGTATTVGDVVEVAALRMLFEEAGWAPANGARTALGSVKANIGHTMSAAGIAGLIKAALALHHRALPPQPSVGEENPKLELARGPFFLPRSEVPWESNGTPRRAGVSSFGFGGTNAHLAPEPAPPVQLLPGAVFAQGPFAERKVALLFPGQGAQKIGLLREAYEQIPAFAEALDRLDPSRSLRQFLYAEPSIEAEKRLTATE